MLSSELQLPQGRLMGQWHEAPSPATSLSVITFMSVALD